MGNRAPLLSIAAVTLLLTGCQITLIDGGERRRPGGRSSPDDAVGAYAMGSGRVVSETRQVAGFDLVVVRGSGTLLLQQTGSESLAIEAEDNILPLLTSEVSGRRLTLGVLPGSSFRATKPIVYRLTVKDLHGVEVAGSGNVEATGIKTDRLTLTASGSSNLSASGTADRLEVEISGSGEYRGDDLQSREASVEISGSGDAIVAVSDQLDASVSGSGTVTYIGDPEVTRQVSGSGSITKR